MTSISAAPTDEPSPLGIYLEYEYLLVEDLSDLLDSVRVVYEQAFWHDIPALIGTQHQRAYGIQIVRANTSRSILLELQALGQTIAGLDPTLTGVGVGGGVVALGLTARILIHTFTMGHEALSAAQTRSLEIQARRNEIEASGARTGLEIERSEVDLEVVRRDADFREFIQSATRATASADFARAISRNEDATEKLGGALLNAWSMLQSDNIVTARINDVEIKPVEGESATEGEQEA